MMQHNQFYYITTILIYFLFLPYTAFCEEKKQDYTISLKTGSYVYHLNKSNNVDYTESFNNNLFSVGIPISDRNELVIGSFLNSYNDRCILLGLERNWYNFNPKLSFQGIYAYAGEFFFKQFSNCQDNGIYQNFQQATSIGFVPYLYHGLRYDVFSFFSIEGGLIFPEVLATTIRWKF